MKIADPIRVILVGRVQRREACLITTRLANARVPVELGGTTPTGHRTPTGNGILIAIRG
jgi:hypothetical protein